MKNLLIVMAMVIFTASNLFALKGKEFSDCTIKASKSLEEDNKKCHGKFGENGSKDRKGFNKCKYQAKGKYEAACEKCKE